MKKEDISALIVYVLIIALAIVFGVVILQNRTVPSSMAAVPYAFFIVGAILVGVVFNSIMYEVAHIIGAKIGRYDILKVNILGFCFYKTEDNKFKFRFQSFDGLTGETKILPKKDAKKEPNPKPYLLFGTVFFVIELAICVTLFVLFNLETNPVLADIGYFLLVVMFIGGMIFIYNVIPFKLDSTTDGYRLTLVSNPKNKVAFNELLRVEHELSLGNKDVEIKTFDTITNFTADLNLNKVYILLEKEDYDNALVLINQILANKNDISGKVYIRALAQKVYIYFMTLPLDEASKLLDEEVPVEYRREISKDDFMVSSRAYILLAGLIDKSKSECILTINNIQKAFKRTQQSRRGIEIKLFNKALDKVIEAHPDWNFDQYHLKELDESDKKK